jgi:hypothetical protein
MKNKAITIINIKIANKTEDFQIFLKIKSEIQV